jgi:hypothetical protein
MILFHVSEINNRYSILINGINTDFGISPWHSPEDPIKFPKGNYLWPNFKEAVNYGHGLYTGDPFDIWEVKIDDKDLILDPITDDSYYSIVPITKEYIIKLHKYNSLSTWKLKELKRISELNIHQILDEITEYETIDIKTSDKINFTQNKLTEEYSKKATTL